MLLGIYFWLFSAAYANDTDYEVVVTPSDVTVYVDNAKIPKHLGRIVSTYASLHKNLIKKRLTSQVAPEVFEGQIKIIDKVNVNKINEEVCNYDEDSIGCSIKNRHWLIVPTITREKLHANFNLSLYDDQGELISSSTTPIWGFVQILPQFKKTTITENSMFGPVKREILEQYPPKRKEVPPMVNSVHVSNAMMLLYMSIEVENI
jgi:hypothetical protein